jgi:glycogen operon protein
MTRRNWQDRDARALGVFLNGREIGRQTPEGERVEDDSFLLLLNAHHEPVVFTLPPRRFGARWAVELATAKPERRDEGPTAAARDELAVEARSLLLLRRA